MNALLGKLVDGALDRTIVGGYTSVGYRIRSRGWEESELLDMAGKSVLVTGATSGLGLAAATGFARLGASVTMLARDLQRGQDARSVVAEHAGGQSAGQVTVEKCDLADLGSVRRFARRFSERAQRLDVVVHNAGVMTQERELSVDGIELTFATNVVGPFLATHLLLDLLKSSAPARVISVSSGGMYAQRIHADDLQTEYEEFDGPTAYARSKRAEVILTEMWSQRLAGTGVVAHSMHPGWADTPGVASSLPRFYKLTKPVLRTPDQGADTIVWLGAAAEPARSTGGFWHDRRRRPTHLLPWTRENTLERERLWAKCVELSGLGGRVTEHVPVRSQ